MCARVYSDIAWHIQYIIQLLYALWRHIYCFRFNFALLLDSYWHTTVSSVRYISMERTLTHFCLFGCFVCITMMLLVALMFAHSMHVQLFIFNFRLNDFCFFFSTFNFFFSSFFFLLYAYYCLHPCCFGLHNDDCNNNGWDEKDNKKKIA